MQGATATVSLRQPRTEAHLSQLAVLENFAEHGLYVKFSNEEAEELEREALALALEESTQEVGSDRGASGLSPVPFSKEEAEQIAAQLMEAAPLNLPNSGRQPNAQPTEQKPTLRSKGSFKGLFGFKDKGKNGKPSASSAPQPLPREQPQATRAEPMSASATAKSQASAIPMQAASPSSPRRLLKPASPRKVIFQEESLNGLGQSTYESALADARALRAELEAGAKQHRAVNETLVKRMQTLYARQQRKNPTVQAVEEFKQAQIQVETAEVQLDVIEEGIDELTSLEKFIQGTHPPEESASVLAHEVVRQLLACLSHVGIPSRVLAVTPLQGSKATKPDPRAERLVAHFRKECQTESPKPLPSLPDIPEEVSEAEESQELQEVEIQGAAAESQTPPRQSANMAFAAESPDPSKGSLCIGQAKPLPARHKISTVPAAAADRETNTSGDTLRAHALTDFGPSASLPDGPASPELPSYPPSSQDPPQSSDASAIDSETEAAVQEKQAPPQAEDKQAEGNMDVCAAAAAPMQAGAQEPPAAPRSDGDADVQHDSAAAGIRHENLLKQQAAEQGPQTEAGHPGELDLESTDLLSSRALGPLGVALKDREELPAKPAAGSAPSVTRVAPQEAACEGLDRQDSEGTAQRKKKRSTFGSFFKRKSPPANVAQEAQSLPEAGVHRKAEVARQREADDEGAQVAQLQAPAQQSATLSAPQARPEEDAVDRAAAAQLRLASQSSLQRDESQRQPAQAAAASANGGVDAAVAKQSNISAKLAGSTAVSAAAAEPGAAVDGKRSPASAAVPGGSPEAPAEVTTSRLPGGSTPRASAVRSRVRSASARHRKGASAEDSTTARTATAPQELKENPQVDSLFQELDKILPNNFMSQTFEDASAGTISATPASSNLTQAQLELAKLDAEKHAGLVKSLSNDISEFQASDMPSLVEFVRDTSARLGVIMTDEAAVLSHFPTWPQVKWNALRDAADAYSELSEFARREKQWLLQRGTCEEEVQRIESFLDTAMARTQTHAARQGASEAKWKQQGIPWDASIYRSVRANSLHLATLYMSRVLFEVASLERSEDTVQEACLRHLAASVRAAHKIHGFAGGFDAELSSLFDKVRRLANYYVRILEPPSNTDERGGQPAGGAVRVNL